MKIIVIGGGASGLTSAITAARNGASVTILERNNTCGKKILKITIMHECVNNIY